MLVIKAFVSDTKLREIGKIGLVNTGHVKNGKHLYRFREPIELNNIEIYHDRKKPWTELVEKALHELNLHQP